MVEIARGRISLILRPNRKDLKIGGEIRGECCLLLLALVHLVTRTFLPWVMRQRFIEWVNRSFWFRIFSSSSRQLEKIASRSRQKVCLILSKWWNSTRVIFRRIEQENGIENICFWISRIISNRISFAQISFFSSGIDAPCAVPNLNTTDLRLMDVDNVEAHYFSSDRKYIFLISTIPFSFAQILFSSNRSFGQFYSRTTRSNSNDLWLMDIIYILIRHGVIPNWIIW